jgi:hypothetical protein
VRRLFLALALVVMLPSERTEAAKDDANICALRLQATKAGGKPRTLEFVSAYIGDPIVIQKPEYYDLPSNRFRWEWLVDHDPDFFMECRYTGGETIHAHVPSSATTCEMRAHKLGRHNYRPDSITCR